VALSLKTILTDISPTAEGCALLVKHKVLDVICDVSELHWMDVKIQVCARACVCNLQEIEMCVCLGVCERERVLHIFQ
jgi:hypothetical protein